jgi:hypothetical protein
MNSPKVSAGLGAESRKRGSCPVRLGIVGGVGDTADRRDVPSVGSCDVGWEVGFEPCLGAVGMVVGVGVMNCCLVGDVPFFLFSGEGIESLFRFFSCSFSFSLSFSSSLTTTLSGEVVPDIPGSFPLFLFLFFFFFFGEFTGAVATISSSNRLARAGSTGLSCFSFSLPLTTAFPDAFGFDASVLRGI